MGQDSFKVGRHDLHDVNPAVSDRVDEPLDIQDHLLLDQQGPPAGQERGNQLPQRDVEALRRGLGDHLPRADAQVADLGEQVVEHARVLAHRPLGLTGGAGSEVDVGELVRRDADAEIPIGIVLLAGRVDQQRLDAGQRAEGRLQGGGAAGLGQHQPAPGPGQRGRDAVGREMRLDGQVHAARFEDRQDGGHPAQVALGHHRYHAFAAQPPRQQSPAQPVGPGVQLPVAPLPVAVHGRDRVRVRLNLLLEQLMEPAVRQLPARPGEPFELEAQFPGRQQALPPVLGIWTGGDQRERGQVITGDPGRAVRVKHVGPVPQPQHQPAAGPADPHPQHGASGQPVAAVAAMAAIVAGRVELGLERWPSDAQLAAEITHREVLVRQQLRLGAVSLQQQPPPRAGPGGQPARQRRAAPAGDIAGHHLRLAGQRGQDLGVRGQQHRAERHCQLVRPPAQRRREVIGDRRLMPGDTSHRVQAPPRDRGRAAGGEQTAPELPASP